MAWTLAYDAFEPGKEGLREALTSTGNGYFCTRGAMEWADMSDVHYPGTYMHGGYNRAITMMAGRPVYNEDLVNLPNWLVLKLRIEDDEPFTFDDIEILAYRHIYDLRYAAVMRTLTFRDHAQRETTITSRRFASMADMHQGALEWTITAENWSGRVEVISALEGRVINWGVARYRQLENHHLNAVHTRATGPDNISLLVQTRQSHIYIAQAARTRVYGHNEVIRTERQVHESDAYINQTLSFYVREKQPVRIEKMCALYTSRDLAISEPLSNAEHSARHYGEFEAAYQYHMRAWDELWASCDVRLPKDDHVQKLIRFHMSHVLQVCSPNTTDIDAGVPARGLNGEAYRGHVFWDELYIYPFINFRLPGITRELLMYRYRRLDEARKAAKEKGFRGAMYPWQSGSDGKEETPTVHLNPKSGRWDPDLSHNQRHVNAAIFYNIWEYYRATADIDFIWEKGAEMMLEIARFWSSSAHYNEERGRYEIHGVMGPDEFHEKYPGSREEGLRNNAYTNIMVAWMCETAGRVLELLPERRRKALCGKIGLTDEEISLWQDMTHKMFVPFHKDGLISQFEGYETLDELDWDAYRAKYPNIQRLDRILKAEGDTPDRYKLAKQADTLMLFFLFREERLKRLFSQLGYEYGPDTAARNIAYYRQRTSHGSTLSYIVHAGIEADLDPQDSWSMFIEALQSDIGDIQGGTTKEGIHMGVMAGTLDLIQRGYLGAEMSEDVLYFKPKLIDKLDGLFMPMQFRGTFIEVSLENGKLTISPQPYGLGRSIKVGVNGEFREIAVGESHTFIVGDASEAEPASAPVRLRG